MNIVELLILVLATWRITNLIVDDSEAGPWDILNRIRYLAGYRYDEMNRPASTNIVSSAMLCFWCLSFWVGFILLLVSLLPYWIGYYILLPFALSAGALLVKKQIR